MTTPAGSGTSLLNTTGTLNSANDRPEDGRRLKHRPLEVGKQVRFKPATARTNPRAWLPADVCDQIRDVTGGCAPWPMLYQGGTGSGKTCAALWITDFTRGQVRFLSFDRLCMEVTDAKRGELRCAGSDAKISPTQFWKEWGELELAVIDDLGTRDKASDAQYETLKLALDERDGLPLILTSNLTLKKLIALFDDRIGSRLSAGTVVEFPKKDHRRTNDA